MPGKKLWLSLLLVAFISSVLGVAATADAGTESEFVSLINSTRANNGLGSLEVDGGLRAHARNHTQAMIDKGEPKEVHPSYWAPFVVVGEGAAAN